MSKALTIQEMQSLAKKRGGKCLSKKYINAMTKLKWRCQNGHIWKSTPYSAKSRKSWCPICAISKNADKKRSTIQEMCHIAEKRSGQCLSKRYINNTSNLKWRCTKGHTWKAVPKVIKKGGWCPMCLPYISEKICREIFQNIFKKKFIKIHPKWLVSENDRRMELDGYCKKLGLAFEYQGRQHYQPVRLFKDSNLTELKKIDNLKKHLCKKERVKLIIIPYTVGRGKLYDFIIRKLKKNKIIIPKHQKFSLQDLNIYSSQRLLEEMKEIAKKRGGECLSEFFIDGRTKLEWRCAKNHIWEAIPESVKSRTWCPFCARNVKLNIFDMRKEAKGRGGLCLSKRYINSQRKLKWQCKKGHIWKAVYGSIQQGSWCPKCANAKGHEKLKSNIQEMQKIAEKRGGKCLSKWYMNSQTHLEWQCAEGHVWKAIPNNIKRSRWCPFCAKQR